MEENRNVFQQQNVSSIPIFDIDPSYVPFSQRDNITLENMFRHGSRSDHIEIHQIELNHRQRQIEVWIRAIQGEAFTLRVSTSPHNHHIYEHHWVHDSDIGLAVQLDLDFGLEYNFTLFDNHNQAQHTFSFISPTDFHVVPQQLHFELSEVAKGKGDKLDNTSDLSLATIGLLAVLGMVAITLAIKWKHKAKTTFTALGLFALSTLPVQAAEVTHQFSQTMFRVGEPIYVTTTIFNTDPNTTHEVWIEGNGVQTQRHQVTTNEMGTGEISIRTIPLQRTTQLNVFVETQQGEQFATMQRIEHEDGEPEPLEDLKGKSEELPPTNDPLTIGLWLAGGSIALASIWGVNFANGGKKNEK